MPWIPRNLYKKPRILAFKPELAAVHQAKFTSSESWTSGLDMAKGCMIPSDQRGPPGLGKTWKAKLSGDGAAPPAAVVAINLYPGIPCNRK